MDRDSGKAVIIDPVWEQIERDSRLLQELGVSLTYVLETHIHADHITAASMLKDRTGAQIVYGAANDVDGADQFIKDGETLAIGSTLITALATPGHTGGCTSYYVEGDDGEGAVFTGDTLLIRGCGRTDFQSGSAASLYHSVHDKLFTLPDETIVYPAHDYKGMLFSRIGEEKKYNPRLKIGESEEDFIKIMDNLKLDHPKKIAAAVPANMKAGRTGYQ